MRSGLNSAGLIWLLTTARAGHLTAAVARGRGERREIARHHRRRRHERDVGRRRLTRRGALIGAEEEQLVPHHRSAERAAELIAQQSIVLALAGGLSIAANGLVALNL
jgi:hypothetical protein